MSTTAKLVHLSTERRRRKYTPPDPLKVELLKSLVDTSLAEVDRLFAADSAQLIEAVEIGSDPC